jgi:hypothetical protein
MGNGEWGTENGERKMGNGKFTIEETKPPFNAMDASRPVPAAIPLHSDEPPIHPLSAALLIAIDNLWLLADWAVLMWIVTIPLSFFAVCIPVYLVQRHMRGDPPGRAMAIATLLGVLAAIPTSITGSTAGLMVLGYSGLRRILRRRK